MIQANCRARFTAADFQFIVRTLARSPHDQVSLVDLLSDVMEVDPGGDLELTFLAPRWRKPKSRVRRFAIRVADE